MILPIGLGSCYTS